MASLIACGKVRESIISEINQTLNDLNITGDDKPDVCSDAVPYALRSNASDTSFLQLDIAALYRVLSLARIVKQLSARLDALEDAGAKPVSKKAVK